MNHQATLGQPAGVPADFHSCIGAFAAEFDFVYHVLRRHGVSDPDAEDLVQEVFLVMWRHWAVYDSNRPLRPWLAGIAFRVAYNYRHRHGRETPGGLMDPRDHSPSPEDRLASASARSLVTRVLATLPEKHRTLIVAYDLEGIAMRDIARTLGVPLFTAHTRLRAARHAFAKALKRMQTVSAARASMPALQRMLAEQARQPPPPVPPPARDRAISRARGVALLPGFGLGPRPGEGSAPAAASPSASALASAQGISFGLGATLTIAVGVLAFVWWQRPAPRSRAVAATAVEAPAAGTAAAVPRAARVMTGVAAHTRLAPQPAEPREATALNHGLVGYWRFDDGYGSTSARDLSGNGNDCLLRKVDPERDWTDGPLGGALAFNGRGWLECPKVEGLARLSTEMTIAVWVKRTGSKRNVRALVTRQFGNLSLDTFHFGFSEESLALRSRFKGMATFAPFPAGGGRWFHVAATRDDSGVARLFIDGQQVRRKAADRSSLGGGTNPMIVGGGTNGTDPTVRELLEAVIDELVIYDRPLADAEIRALAAGAQPRLIH